ncbi:MAG: hypothetical protein HYX71_01320 [Opitutae bacterium]|nr:hypothetical protein [Opitutae bacterium]
MPMHLPAAEKIGLGAIPIATALVAWLAPRAGLRLETGGLLAGDLLKDFAVSRAPGRVFRGKDHAQLIVRWRK